MRRRLNETPRFQIIQRQRLNVFDPAAKLGAAAIMAIVGLIVTYTMLPEPNGQTLEAASKDVLLEENAGAPVRHAFA